MSGFAISMFVVILLGLVASFAMLVYPGADNCPSWVVVVSYVMTALGGGAGINIILFGVPK